ncbi:MAG: hypothetical protein S4CHLAM6_07950 [Chlamydiae bacterium]|nr:hypothetical protein [Chlamydiota bacterium]
MSRIQAATPANVAQIQNPTTTTTAKTAKKECEAKADVLTTQTDVLATQTEVNKTPDEVMASEEALSQVGEKV